MAENTTKKKSLDSEIEKVKSVRTVSTKIPEREANDTFAKKAEGFFEPIINDVIIPSAQDTLIDIFNSIFNGIMNGITEAITGEPCNNRSVAVRRGSKKGGRTDYNGVSSGRNNRNSRNRDSGVSETTRLRDLTVKNQQEAKSVIIQLREILDAYDRVTCNDLYGLEEIDKTCPYTYTNFGWYDLSEAGIIRNSDGTYSFDLPKPVQLTR